MSKKKKLRGAFVSALSLSMALSSMGAVSAQSVNDVKGHWAEQQIDSWIANGSLKGYQDGSVKPNSAITRAEFIVLVNRLFEFSETASADFKDLSPSNWAYNDVAKALKAGYVKGYSDNTFQPSSNVSRQEAASMISSVLGLDPSNSEGIKQFKDAGKIPAWSQGSIAAVIEKGIMKGYPDGTFQAQKQLTRAEAIVLIDSALNNRTVAKETLSIDTPGTYGSAQETKVVNGDVIINVAGVTLENYEIKGDLLLASGIGSGDVTIKNVKVHGTTNVEGGGENSIHFVDSVLVNVLVNKKDGTVRLVAEGTTTAQKVIVQSSAKVEENELKGEGFTDIELAKELPSNAKVQLNGKFDDVDVFSASVTVQLQRGSIQDVKVDATAANNTIQISAGAQVVNLVLNAISKILGASNITTVTLNSGSQNSAFDVRPSNVQGDQKGSIVVNTPSTTVTAPSGESSSGGSSSGGSSSGGSSGGSTGGGAINQEKPTGLSPKGVTEAGNDGKITGVTAAMEYRLKGTTNWASVSGTEITGLVAGTYEVRYAAKAGFNAGAVTEVVVVADQAAPTGLSFTAVTATGNDGTITGVTDAMEYRLKDSNNAWTAVTGTEITELVAGTYEVRYAAKTGHNAGSVEEVTVAAYVAPDTTVTKMQENSDLNTGAVSFNWSSINGIGSKDKLENTNGSSYNYYSDGAYIALQLTDAEGNVLPFNDVLSEITLQTNDGTVDTIPDSNREKADFGIEGFEQYKTVLAQPMGGNSLFYGLRQSSGVAHTVGFEAGAKRTINLTVKAKESAVVGTYTITIFTAQQGTEFKSQGEALKYTVEVKNQDQKAPEGLNSTAVTAAGNDGKITGVTDAMEYRLKDSNNAWTAVTGTEITELVAGTYEVRYAAKTGHNAGSVEEVTVAAYVAPDTTVTKMQENSDLNTGAVSFNWSSINGIGSKDKLENTNGSSYNYYSDGAYIALQLTDAEGNVLPFNDVLSEITLQTNDGTVDTIPDSNREKADFGIEGFEQYKTVLAQPMGGNSLFYGLRQSSGVAHTVGFEAGAKRTINLTVKAKESAVVGTYTITIFTAQQGTEFKSQGEALKYTVEVKNQDQKAPEGLNSTAVTATGNDGTITGVTDEMEYRLQGASDWTKVTAESTTITGLASGTYEVRYAAKTGHNAGSVEEVTVAAYVAE